MKNPIDFIYKVSFFPWILFILFINIMLLNAYFFHSSNQGEEEIIALSIFLIIGVVVIRFTHKSWNYYLSTGHSEILLDEFESEVKSDPVSNFPDYKITCFLSVLVGGSSVLLSVWMFLKGYKFGLSPVDLVLSTLLKLTLLIYGITLIIRSLTVWSGISKNRRSSLTSP